MKTNEMTAAQRIMLEKGQPLYVPKPISIKISPRNELVLFAIPLLMIVTYLAYMLYQNIFMSNTNYGTTIFLFLYSIHISYGMSKFWKQYKTNKATK